MRVSLRLFACAAVLALAACVPQPAQWNGDIHDHPFLVCTRGHESDTAGGYGAVSPGGKYRGAYQFDQRTWDGAVSRAGHPEWAGRWPNEAPVEVQDAAAYQLMLERGAQPWGLRCAQYL